MSADLYTVLVAELRKRLLDAQHGLVLSIGHAHMHFAQGYYNALSELLEFVEDGELAAQATATEGAQ